MITLYSSIHSDLMKSSIFRGTFLGSFGIFLLLLGGNFMTASTLQIWGIPVFVGSLSLITVGLLPYKKLRTLELKPYKVTIENDDSFEFHLNKKKTITILFSEIEAISYKKAFNSYGIIINFKEKYLKDNPSLAFYSKQSKKTHGCDFFLPYFSKRSYNELLEVFQCRSS